MSLCRTQVTLIVTTLGLSWLGMMAVHELGHVAGAWWTGGRVERVVLHPLQLSRTDLAENPHPLAVVWAGPSVGVLLPLSAWLLAVRRNWRVVFLLRFFAGFCLVANGGYIAAGSFSRAGDAGEMLRHGSAMWHLWILGAITIPLGFALWHGQGPHFGLGTSPRPVDRGIANGMLLTFLSVVVIEFCLASRL